MGIDTNMKSLRVYKLNYDQIAYSWWPILEKWRYYKTITKYDNISKEHIEIFKFRHLEIREVSKISTNPIHD